MRTFILLLLMQLVSLPFSYARQPEHSTYLWGIQRSGFFNGRGKWAKGFENQMV